jgi:adenylate kinase family enzyme
MDARATDRQRRVHPRAPDRPKRAARLHKQESRRSRSQSDAEAAITRRSRRRERESRVTRPMPFVVSSVSSSLPLDTTRRPTVTPPFVVEIAGPAGSGKSTLCAALSGFGVRSLSDRPSVREPSQLSYFLGSGLRLLPTLLRQPRDGRWYTRDELARMFYLTGIHRVWRDPEWETRVVSLDHGPVFQMSHLREFGPERMTGPAFDRWWSDMFRHWGRTLDLVVWLDAPDEVLIERIRERGKRHYVKAASTSEARLFLRRYRSAHRFVLSRLVSESSLRVLRFSTDSDCIERITQRVLDEIAPETGGDRSCGVSGAIDPVPDAPLANARNTDA